MFERFRSEAGETLVESLVSMLIATLCFAFLAMSIALVARANASVASARVTVSDSEFVDDGGETARISSGGTHVDVDVERQVVTDDSGEVRYVRYVAR